MTRRWLIGAALAASSSPAPATQGMICEGKGASIYLLYGHAAVPGLLKAELEVGGKAIPTAVAQSWAGDKDTMIDLADTDQMEVLAKIRLKWVRQSWRGTLSYQKRTYAITCGEAG